MLWPPSGRLAEHRVLGCRRPWFRAISARVECLHSHRNVSSRILILTRSASEGNRTVLFFVLACASGWYHVASKRYVQARILRLRLTLSNYCPLTPGP